MRSFMDGILAFFGTVLVLAVVYDIVLLGCRLTVWIGTHAKGVPGGW